MRCYACTCMSDDRNPHEEALKYYKFQFTFVIIDCLLCYLGNQRTNQESSCLVAVGIASQFTIQELPDYYATVARRTRGGHGDSLTLLPIMDMQCLEQIDVIGDYGHV